MSDFEPKTDSHATLLKFLFLIGQALWLVGCTGGGSTAASPPPEVFAPSSIKSALDYGIDRGVDGIWLYVDQGEGNAQVETAGLANRETAQPTRPDSLFKIASISKLFLAVSATKLVATDVVRLDDTIEFWLPDVANRIENSDRITLRLLLQHRSGIPDFDSQDGFSWREAHTDINELVALFVDKPADFLPDARYEYSNSNYLLIGMILDAALGYSHHDHVQSEILSPLGMNQTFSLQSDTTGGLLARGYWDDIDHTDREYVAPGGSMVSTARDTGIFLRQLATGGLLSSQERDIYLSVFDSYSHSGWLPGYQSIARYNSATNTVLVQLVNTTGGGSEDVATQVYELVVDYLRSN